ncbi:hypothetical protein BUALT_Bualt12G0135500 [Buddleja alternifolia]|uniref:EGF-like domain-containing protein n=1 Tax=Buddleja alternifolia TaxID=168488 RepID=A0AAV6WVZ6_9LAMI|nr:hypothetical protein BUALT_Bualt12G0135500 [Buddleja alternifolia]
MAKVYYAAFLAILLLLQSHIAAATLSTPVLASSGGDVCRENVCGRGKCEVSRDSTFGFECKCEDGWMQARSRDDNSFKFLPCVIPNCILNNDCFGAPPARNNEKQPNLSSFDPCYLIDCGGGTCKTTSPFTHMCECERGYHNLINSTAFPCYKSCAFGNDCPNVGREFENTPPSILDPNPTFGNSIGQAPILIQGANFSCLIAITSTLAMVYMEIYLKMQ